MPLRCYSRPQLKAYVLAQVRAIPDDASVVVIAGPKSDLFPNEVDLLKGYLAKGGKLYLGEFHKPTPLVLKCLSWSYFKVFEPLGLALWDSHDPVAILEEMGGWKTERRTFFFDNFQIITATKL